MMSMAVLPTFATRWLGTRLGAFLGQHPGISVNLSTRIGWFDFATDAFDAAIYFGDEDWSGGRHLRLFDERMTACISPALAASQTPRSLEDLARLPLMTLESRPNAWADWFAGQGVAARGGAGGGMMMDQFSMMIQAAITGLGVALLPDYLARTEIAEGRLQPVFAQAVPIRGAYWLVWPEAREPSAPLRAFRGWLAGQADAG